ncbi:hypothetical protein [Odoribacter laneus]|uniref:Uncharacterized protein n=1 Tax=Odoribacter laneus YIT 12061 TaxID=742817 RepID=H1DEJ2_9BACT|nr:hypothetical protein [Odoribacter laneus]EHP49892.1 hypothetical protein HMPREF9449_00678 [Odoribacter laneus YIT 12061]
MAMGTAFVWGVVTFLAEGFANYKLNEKLSKFFSSQKEFKQELYQVILATLTEYEEKYPVMSDGDKFPFYDSQAIINELLKYRLFGSAIDLDCLIEEFKKNDHIIIPSKSELETFLNLFYEHIQGNIKLRNLEIERGFKEEIFCISTKLNQLSSSFQNTLASMETSLKEEWKRQLEAYKEHIEKFRPRTALELLIKLETAIADSEFTVNEKFYSKLHYWKAGCYELLTQFPEARKEYIFSYKKDKANNNYKKKAAYAYYKSGKLEEAIRLAKELKEADDDSSVIYFILLFENKEGSLYDKIKILPEYVRKTNEFKFLILAYVRDHENGPAELREYLIREFEIEPIKQLTFDNFYTCVLHVDYANYVYIQNGLRFEFTKRTAKSPEWEIIYKETHKLVSGLKGSEVENIYQGAFFLYYLADYVVNDQNEQLLEAKRYLSPDNVNGAMMLANCLQFVGYEKEALEVLDFVKEKYEEVAYAKSFCFLKTGDIVHYNLAIKEFIERLDCITAFNFGRVLPVILKLFEHENGVCFDWDLCLTKTFEVEVHKEIVKVLQKIFILPDDADINVLYQLALKEEVSYELKGIIAYILILLGKMELAVSLYRGFIDKKICDRNLFYYIQALYYTKKDNRELLVLMKQWREESGRVDRFILSNEYVLRRKLEDWKECLSIMEILYADDPLNERVFSNYMVSLHENDAFDKIKELKTNLSSIRFTNVECVRDVTVILFQQNFQAEAVEFLWQYAMDRENRGLRLLFFELCNQCEKTVFECFEIVKPDSYVEIKYEDREENSIVYINPNKESDLQKALSGHSMGETVLVKIPACDCYLKVEIVCTMNKYLALYKEIQLDAMHPLETGSPIIALKADDVNDVKSIQDVFIRNFGPGEDQRKRLIKEHLAKYKAGELSFFMLAPLLFNDDFYRTYCVLTTPEYGLLLNPHIDELKEIDLAGKEFVLDFTSLFCLYSFYKSESFNYPHQFIIPKTVADFVKNKVVEIKYSPKQAGVVDICLDKVVPVMYPDNYKEQVLAMWEDMEQWMSVNCHVEIIEEKLDDLREFEEKNSEKHRFWLNYVMDYKYILNRPERILISDDALFYNDCIQDKGGISSQFYLKNNFDPNIVAKGLLRRNYIGVFFEKGFLIAEFVNKLSGKETVFSRCLDSLHYLLPDNAGRCIETLSLFLREIYIGGLVIPDLNREVIRIFVQVLKGCCDVKVFLAIERRLRNDFKLLGTKHDEILVNLMAATKILFPDTQGGGML